MLLVDLGCVVVVVLGCVVVVVKLGRVVVVGVCSQFVFVAPSTAVSGGDG